MFQEEWSESSVSEATPTSLADLCEQLLHRVKEQSALLSTTVEDQQALVSQYLRTHTVHIHTHIHKHSND